MGQIEYGSVLERCCFKWNLQRLPGTGYDSRLFAAERLSGINLRTLCGGSLIFMGLFRLTDFFSAKMDPDALGEWTQFLLFSFRYSCAYTDLE